SWGIAPALFIVLLVFFGMRAAWFDIADLPSSSRALIHATAFLIFVATFFTVAYVCIYYLHFFGVLPRGC
ncbi:MAG: hypothetical protein M3R04_05705, partial [bacterium]|nr:hypothetical protein [bacterium]